MNTFIADSRVDARRSPYTRANACESLAGPASPLGWDLVFRSGLLPGRRQGLTEFGIYQEHELDEALPQVTGMFGGYFYLNLTHLRLTAIRMGMPVESIDTAFVGRHRDVPAHVPHPEDASPGCSRRIARTMEWILTANPFAKTGDDRERAQRVRRERPDLTTLSDAELVARMRAMLPGLAGASARHIFSSLASTVGPSVIGEVLRKAGRAERLLDLLSGLGEVDSAAPSFGLWELAAKLPDGEIQSVGDTAFHDGLKDFLERYGPRGPEEWDIHAPSWESEPALVITQLRQIARSRPEAAPAARLRRLSRRREEAADEIRAAVRGGPDEERFEQGVRSARLFIPARERTKSTTVVLLNEVRMAAFELGRRGALAGRFADPSGITMLLDAELDAYLARPRSMEAVIVERLREYGRLSALEPPFIIDGRAVPKAVWKRRETARPGAPWAVGETVGGIAASGGRPPGKGPGGPRTRRGEELHQGDVLVAPLSDAAWMPLFLQAGAVVFDVGAVNSHGAVLCRELGLPCVVSVTDATHRLYDGTLVTVDGDHGCVTVDAVEGAFVRGPLG